MRETFRLEVEGKDAAQAVDPLRKVLAEAFNGEPVLYDNSQHADAAEAQRGVMEAVLLVLAVPPALDSAINLANRPAVVKKVERVIEVARSMCAKLPDIDIRFVLPGGYAVTLKRASGVDIVNELAKQQREDNDHD